MKYKNNHLKKILVVLISALLVFASVFSGCSVDGDVDNLSFRQVDTEISSIFEDPNFDNLDDSKKIEKIKDTLEQLANEGKIREDSIEYDESNELFTFTYPNGNLGGISLKEFNDDLNSHSVKSTVSVDEDNPELYYESDNELRAIILNGFEDSSYRRDYYSKLDTEWDSKGLDTSVDISVTVPEIKKLNSFDVIVFAMHGSLYNQKPVLCLNQTVNSETDKTVSEDINSNYIAKVYHKSDKTYHYWIMPEFFDHYYSQNEINSKIIFSETCKFFGDDSISKKPDYQMADSLDEISSGAIVGYHNSVGADYSRNVMKATIDNALEGYRINDALNKAKEEYGENDNYDDPSNGKYIAYPIISGDVNSTLIDTPVTDFSIQQDLILTIGEIDVIEPAIEPENANDYSIKWISSNESVATVSPTGENGIITAKAKGEATITAELTSNGKTIIKTTNVRVASQGRDTVLVLDVSGSMSGTPIDEMKKSAIQFCNDLLKDEYNNRVGLVFYDNYIETVDLTNDLNTLVDYIESVNSGATTNMEGGLSAAGDMLNNQGKDGNIKNIVIMADGLPNVGAVSSSGSMPDTSYSSYNSSSEYASAVIDTANSLMKKYNLYSLGFFHSLYGEEKDFAVTLMKELTNMQDGYHQVDEAENLQFAFGDIQETISDGSKIVINIACPVDVNVTYNGETLSSAANTYSDKASFGTLQLLGANKDIKVLSLNPSIDYDIELIGTDTGTMDYSVNYIDDTENIIDYRSFESIPITATTVIDSNTNNAEEVTLSIDEDGDGVVDLIWSASPNSSATLTFGETQTEPEKIPEPDVSNDSDSWKIVLVSVIVVLVFIAAIMIVVFLVSSGKRRNNQIEIPIVNNPPKNNDRDLDKKLPEISTRYAVVISTGSMSGTRFALDNEDTFCIGKGNEPSQINLSSDYSSVSRQHCMVTCNFEEDCYYVTDCSMNGTYFKNGKKLSKNVPTKVTHGTTMQLANSNCEVLFE